jgi:uncharacterized protein (DUF2267 family)
MDFPTFVKRVAELSGVDKEIAGRVVRATLLNLGTRIDPGEADDLAAQLPEAIGVCLRHKWKAQRFPPSEFMRRVACVVPLSNEQGTQAVHAVFTVLREAVSEGELKDVLHQLGGDYATLVGTPTGTPWGVVPRQQTVERADGIDPPVATRHAA